MHFNNKYAFNDVMLSEIRVCFFVSLNRSQPHLGASLGLHLRLRCKRLTAYCKSTIELTLIFYPFFIYKERLHFMLSCAINMICYILLILVALVIVGHYKYNRRVVSLYYLCNLVCENKLGTASSRNYS